MTPTPRPTMYGTTVYPGGRMIEISSPHREWTDYAVRAVNAVDALAEAVRAVQEGFRDGSIKWAKPHQADSDPYHKANMLMCAALAAYEEAGG